MERGYFLQFDYWTESLNKYWHGVISEDLKEISINEVCREIIDSKHHGIHKDSWAIKINALNNITI